MPTSTANELRIEEAVLTKQPYYVPTENEIRVFASAFKRKLPFLLKGPTGCGKTRFVEYMAWTLG
jgi:nitric oxide reductase NorQ protein